MDEIAVRWGSVEDGGAIGRILGLNSMSERDVPKETYIVAEERGEILAVGRSLLAHKRLVLGTLAVARGPGSTVSPWRCIPEWEIWYRRWACGGCGPTATSTGSTCWRRVTIGAWADGS